MQPQVNINIISVIYIVNVMVNVEGKIVVVIVNTFCTVCMLENTVHFAKCFQMQKGILL